MNGCSLVPVIDDDGVKPGPGGPKLKMTRVGIPEDHYEILRAYAAANEVSIAGVIRRLIRDVLVEK